MKGNIDVIYMAIMLVVIVLVLIVCGMIFDVVKAANIFPTGTPAGNGFAGFENGLHIMDAFPLIIVIAVGLATIGSAFLLETNPLYFVIALLTDGFVIILTSVFSNMFTGLWASSPTIASAANSFPLSVLVMQYFPIIAFGLAVLIGIGMYAKGRRY